MRLRLIAVGTRVAGWVDEGYREYARRLPRATPLELVAIPAAGRGKGDRTRRATEAEGDRILAAVPAGDRVVALDERGTAWSTRELARQLEGWMRSSGDVALLIGGPDGLCRRCLERADARWSLSPLTLPHGLVRILVAEQLYRAWSLLNRHPYHRD